MSHLEIAVVNGVRTSFVKAWSVFDKCSAQHLGAACVTELFQRTDIDPAVIDDVIMGCVGQPADASNIARVISLMAGIPKDKKAYTVNRNCASGFEAVTGAAEKIMTGQDEVVIAGGSESMSNVPFMFSKEATALFMKLQKARSVLEKLSVILQFRPGHFSPHPALQLALTDPTCGLNMGQTAEVLARKFAISRKRQDEYALESHKKAFAARSLFKEEIMTLFTGSRYQTAVAYDNGVREKQSMEDLAKLKPIFDRYSGTVTAGNSSQITDGACTLLLMSYERARAMGFDPLGVIAGYEYAGVEPSEMGLGPVFAIEKLLKKQGLSLRDIQLIEINEAFAAQVLSCVDLLGIDPSILNVNGGAIALGHPVGASGARLVLTCLKEMKRRKLHRGLVSLCVGGGQGGAILLESRS
ncbi:MAG: acetyl-CoA acyltransferase [Candidatus Omnitrophica bacterium CG1_02_46_14]|nr:MAG: acetyl-CoA acyltransferase [Candidatus Omnitrophica bacterium CG1_02_46_14]